MAFAQAAEGGAPWAPGAGLRFPSTGLTENVAETGEARNGEVLRCVQKYLICMCSSLAVAQMETDFRDGDRSQGLE